jgi:probable F420-dependent oxidoreductase
VKFGISIFPTDESMSVVELAPMLEERGFESFFVPEHSHIPVSRLSPHPFAAELPRSYTRFLDPFVALSAVATVTTELRIGTGICLVAQHDPIQLAKTVATLDFMSGGRFLFGVAAGWNKEEMENHGTRFSQRWLVMKEQIQAMKSIWDDEAAEFHGRFVDFDPIWAWPKPVQRPAPPILVGGEGPRALRECVEYGDEWMPRLRAGTLPLATLVAQLKAMAVEAGREPPRVTTFGAPQAAQAIDQLERDGVHRCIFTLPSARREEVMPVLDRFTDIVRSFR